MSIERDPRQHGPIACPSPCYDCLEVAHHWIVASVDEYEEFDDLDGVDQAVVAFDAANGTDHAQGFYACKHCAAWAEAELIFEMEDAAIEAAEL